jgi:rRNA maturation protein Nop10
MGDLDPSRFFDLSDFDLRDNGGLVSNEQIDAEEKDARRKSATSAEPLPPPGMEHLTLEQAECEEGKGKGAALPHPERFDPDNPPPAARSILRRRSRPGDAIALVRRGRRCPRRIGRRLPSHPATCR